LLTRAGEMEAASGALQARSNGANAESGLVAGGYRLSELQAQAVLDMRLHRLTGLEQEKILEEYKTLLETIRNLRDILTRPERLTEVVRTEISLDHLALSTEDLIEPQDVVVTLSHAGYAKSQPVAEYQTQRRGGRGR